MTAFQTRKEKIRKTALLGMIFALAIALSFLESFIPSPNGIKLGLSNIVVMYALFFLENRDAAVLAVLKGLFVFLLKGAVAGALSLSGGLLSVTVMAILITVTRSNISYLLVSVAGAVAHNLAQFTAASIILRTPLWYYLPLLLFAGVGAGIVTSILLRLTLPVLGKLGLSQNTKDSCERTESK